MIPPNLRLANVPGTGLPMCKPPTIEVMYKDFYVNVFAGFGRFLAMSGYSWCTDAVHAAVGQEAGNLVDSIACHMSRKIWGVLTVFCTAR